MRCLLAGGLVVAGLLFPSSPAAAHTGPGGSDAPASNYRSRVLAVEPALDGVDVSVVEAGDRMELVNTSDVDVVVLGYQDEPYLRAGPDGIFENTLSPTLYLNQDRQGGTDVPERADPEATPSWQRVDGGRSIRWHDHRVHWIGGEDPAVVAAAPEQRHVIDPAWELPLRAADQQVTVTGDLTWIPGPAPWPWYGLALMLVVALIAAAWWRHWRAAVIGATAAFLGAVAIDSISGWRSNAAATSTRAAGLALPLMCALLAVAGLTLLWHRPRYGIALIGAAASGFVILFGADHLGWLSHSQLPTTLHRGVARTTVAVTLGLGFGCALLSALVLVRTETVAVATESEGTAS